VLLSAFVFAASYRFVARAAHRDWISNSFDAFLLAYLVQYLAVTIPGMLGILSAAVMCLAALLMSGTLLLLSFEANGTSNIQHRTSTVEITALRCSKFD